MDRTPALIGLGILLALIGGWVISNPELAHALWLFVKPYGWLAVIPWAIWILTLTRTTRRTAQQRQSH